MIWSSKFLWKFYYGNPPKPSRRLYLRVRSLLETHSWRGAVGELTGGQDNNQLLMSGLLRAIEIHYGERLA